MPVTEMLTVSFDSKCARLRIHTRHVPAEAVLVCEEVRARPVFRPGLI